MFGDCLVTKPLLILDQYFRTVEELFDPDTYDELSSICRIEGGQDQPMDIERVSALLKEATFLVAARPRVTQADIQSAPNLRAVIEVSGAFNDGIDYAACFERGIDVLSCAPGFREAVAEMGLAMLLSASRGLVAEHEAFRQGGESWLDDREETDFTVYRQQIGFIGYGNIAREMHALLRPFAPKISAYDPWLTTFPQDVSPLGLDDIFKQCRAIIVAAVPDADNRHMIGAKQIDAMQTGSALILISRAHVLDFDVAVQAASAGRITFATDVFPSEPADKDHPIRTAPNVILSPHRAAAVPRGRQLIGRMILHDVKSVLNGDTRRQLVPANPSRVEGLIAAQRAIEKSGKLDAT
ncbi:NAD(P)-dependent oxidoreductase [Tateyamaria armeniaca]|uniref:NAD(P)-dependent oxidoreductase n=1 Tax=Tateyamaria armeniaca TaxID=2518930 RepID=A0ABW8US18_9RHOB